MEIVPAGVTGEHAVDHHADEGRPHIDKIQAVKAVGNHQNIRRKCGAVGTGAAEDHNQCARRAANSRVKKGGGKTAQSKIVGHQL